MGEMGQHHRGVFTGNGLFFFLLSNFPNPFPWNIFILLLINILLIYFLLLLTLKFKISAVAMGSAKREEQSWWLVTVSAHSNARGARAVLSRDND